MCIRDRRSNGNLSYEFKLELAIIDQSHLEKFKNDLDSDFIIKNYITENSFGKNESARLMIYDKYFCENLTNSYNLKPKRNSIESFVDKIPENLMRHFIRGVFDADGSLTYYVIHGNKRRL